MKLDLFIQNSNDGTIYNISNIAEPVEVKKSVDGNAGSLTCVLQKDPNELVKLANGSPIWFMVDGKGIFYGYIFTIGVDADGNYKITAYDQVRYLKNSDIYTFSNTTASNIFVKVCKDFNLKYKVKAPTTYIPPAYQFSNKTLYSIIERGMNLASVNDKKYYYVIDDYGTLTWSEFGVEGSEITIDLNEFAGVTSYTYEKSIDKDTYNQVKLYREDKDAGKIDTWIVKDSNNIKRWGILQLLQSVDETMNSAQIRERAENYLKVKNREVETLKLQGEGIMECIAGKRIHFKIPSEQIDKYMWIISSTHKFTKYEHTMDLEVQI